MTKTLCEIFAEEERDNQRKAVTMKAKPKKQAASKGSLEETARFLQDVIAEIRCGLKEGGDEDGDTRIYQATKRMETYAKTLRILAGGGK